MIYCVEDDADIRGMVVYALRQAGLAAEGFESGPAFWRAVDSALPRLVLLDIMLPGEDGLSILRRLRAQAATAALPVILLTARGAEIERVTGLNAGADDYVAKPFGVLELIARVQALLRRAEKARPGGGPLCAGGLTLDAARHVAADGDTPLPLTYKEFALLEYLMAHKGIAVTRERLLDAVWDAAYAGGTRTVDVHVGTLRQKLGRYGPWIETVRGIGYRFAEGAPCAEE